eukprot:4513997-Alexandrium_andersonii.AAC.1
MPRYLTPRVNTESGSAGAASLRSSMRQRSLSGTTSQIWVLSVLRQREDTRVTTLKRPRSILQ